jgi:hypothetical protein
MLEHLEESKHERVLSFEKMRFSISFRNGLNKAFEYKYAFPLAITLHMKPKYAWWKV